MKALAHPNVRKGLVAVLSPDGSRIVWLPKQQTEGRSYKRPCFPVRNKGAWALVWHDTGELASNYYADKTTALRAASNIMGVPYEKVLDLMYSVGLGDRDREVTWSCRLVVCDPADSEDVLDALQDTLGYMAFSTQTRNPDICKAALDRVVFEGSADAEAIKKYYAKNTRRLLKGRVNNG